MHEFALINEVSKCLDLFYLNDDNFNIKDIINFFYDGKDGDVINDIHLEKFCMKYNINMTHNELRLLLFYLKADFHNIITYNKLKDFFTIFIYYIVDYFLSFFAIKININIGHSYSFWI